MIRNGEPLIPPTCPANRVGKPLTLSPDNYLFMIEDINDGDTNSTAQTELAGAFFDWNDSDDNFDPENSAGIGYVQLTNSTPLTNSFYTIENSDDQHIGELFCDRIENCRGVTLAGECWALGKTAVIDVLTQLANEKQQPHN